MKIDLSCPAELWRYELPRKDYRACDLILYNLSEKQISSMEFTLILFDGDKEELARLIYRAHDLKGESGKTFSASVPVEDDVAFKDVEIIIEKVWWEDQSVWRRGKGPMTQYESNALPNGRSLENLRFLAGPTAVGYPKEQDDVWLCVCGRPNAHGQSSCVRCHQARKHVFEQYNEENVKQLTWQREQRLHLKAKAAREDASVRQLKREAEYNARKKRRRRVLTAIGCTAAGLCMAYGVVFHLLPYVKYQQAVTQVEEGNWAQAQAAFADMGDYRDAQAYILRCRYLIAEKNVSSGKEETLLSAREELLSLGDYEKAPELIRQAEYTLAGLWLKEGQVQKAREQYDALGDYEDCAAQVTYCDYLLAKDLLEEKQYEEARTALEALGDYEDAKALAVQSVLLPGRAALDAGDPDAALALLEQIAQEDGVAELIKAAHYKKGEALQQEGDMTAAGSEFLLAGDYENAADRANDCIYIPAMTAKEQGNFKQAAELFGKIPDYQDAAQQQLDCYYQHAVYMMKDTEYAQAREALALLPDDYLDVADLRLQCLYLPALAAYERGDYQAAIEVFEQLGDYKKSASNLKKARYALAGQYLDMAVFDQAIALYEQLGDYKESKSNLKKARYSKAEELLAQGDTAGAEEIYLQLGDYKKSEERVNKIRYDRACALFDAGDLLQAKEAFLALGKYGDAAKMAHNCDYITAEDHLAKGRYDEAIAIFKALEDYQDAAARVQEGYYLKAKSLADEALWLEAAALYLTAGDYNDAAIQAEIMYAAYYQPYEKEAGQLMDKQQYAQAVALLRQLDMTTLPKTFAALKTTFEEACFLQGEKLFASGKPYEALPYYQQVPAREEVRERLKNNCYRLLGQWTDQDGVTYLFRTNGTLSIGGDEMFFRVDDFAMSTGTSLSALQITHSVSAVGEKEAILFEVQGGQTRQLHLKRDLSVQVEALPLPDIAAAVTEAMPQPEKTEDMTVIDEE